MAIKVYYLLSQAQNLSAQAHLLLREIVGFTDEINYGAHGKPYFVNHPDLHFNLTHTKGLAACAVSDAPVGIDAEHERIIRPALAARCFSKNEISWAMGDQTRLLTLWTRKEAYLKQTGEGISRPLREVEVLSCPSICSMQPEKGFILSVCGSFGNQEIRAIRLDLTL